MASEHAAANSRGDDNIRRARSATRRQSWRNKHLIKRRADEDLADARLGGIIFERCHCVRGVRRILQPEERDVVFCWPDPGWIERRLGERQERSDEVCRRLAIRSAVTWDGDTAFRVDRVRALVGTNDDRCVLAV